MESLFPQLFFLSYFATFVLRIGAAIGFAILAHHLYQKRHEIAETSFWLVGKPAMPLIWIKIGFVALIAAFLLGGIFTQGAAIAGALVAGKSLLIAKKYPAILTHSRLAYFLLLLLCLFLLVSGAGPFAIDLPY